MGRELTGLLWVYLLSKGVKIDPLENAGDCVTKGP